MVCLTSVRKSMWLASVSAISIYIYKPWVVYHDLLIIDDIACLNDWIFLQEIAFRWAIHNWYSTSQGIHEWCVSLYINYSLWKEISVGLTTRQLQSLHIQRLRGLLNTTFQSFYKVISNYDQFSYMLLVRLQVFG